MIKLAHKESWKLIKAELSYVKPMIYAMCLLILVQGLWNPWVDHVVFNGNLYEFYTPSRSFQYMAGMIILWHIGANLILLYRYMIEARVKQQASLPVPMSGILASRLAAPLAIALIFILAGLIPIAYHSVILRNNVQALHNYYSFSYGGDPSQPELFNYLFFLFYRSIGYIWFWLFAVYGCWVFSERYGWYLFGAYLLFEIIQNGLILLFDPKLYGAIGDSINRAFANQYNGNAYLFCAIGFVGLIIVSFITRRSYLR